MLTGPHQTSFSEAGFFTTRLVLGGTARLGAGIGNERAVVRNAGVLFVPNGVLVKRAHRQVAVNLG